MTTGTVRTEVDATGRHVGMDRVADRFALCSRAEVAYPPGLGFVVLWKEGIQKITYKRPQCSEKYAPIEVFWLSL